MGHWQEGLVSHLGQRTQKGSSALCETQTQSTGVASSGQLGPRSSNLVDHYKRGSHLAAWKEGQRKRIGIILPPFLPLFSLFSLFPSSLFFIPSLFFLLPFFLPFSLPVLSFLLLSSPFPPPTSSIFPSFLLLNRQCVQFSSVAQLCPTLCDPMDCSTPGFPVHHQLPGFTQTHVHWVGDAIQPSHPLSSPSPPTFNLSQYQGHFKWVSSLHQVAKVLEIQLQHQSFQWIFRTDFL